MHFCQLFCVLVILAVEFGGGAGADDAADTSPLAYTESSDQNADIAPLKQIFVLFRHGAKVPTPIYLQGKDKNKFKDYVGQLTNEGKMSLYNLGKSIRRRYGKFIGDSYDAQRFFLGSTDMERTLMSAQCFSLGLFPPFGDHIWHESIPWQPIPVFPLQFSLLGNVDQSMKCVAGTSSQVCENADTLFSPQIKETMKIMNSLTPGYSSGNATASLCDFNSLMYLDDLSTMIWYNLTLPRQLKGREKSVDELKTIFIRAMSGPFSKCGKNMAGALIKSFLQHIKDLENGISRQDTIVYSEHDASVMSVVMALSNVDIISPSFGANVIIEVHQPPSNSTQEPQVHMWYAKTAESESKRIPFSANNKYVIGIRDFKIYLQEFMNDIDD